MTINLHTFQPKADERNGKRLLINHSRDVQLLALNEHANERAGVIPKRKYFTGAQALGDTTPLTHNFNAEFSLEHESASDYIDAPQQTISMLVTEGSTVTLNLRSGYSLVTSIFGLEVSLSVYRHTEAGDDLIINNVAQISGGNRYNQIRDHHIAVAIDYANNRYTLYRDEVSLFTTNIAFSGPNRAPVKQDAPSDSPNSIGTISFTKELVDFRIYNRLFSSSDVDQILLRNPYVNQDDIFTFAQNNSLKASGVSGDIDDFSKIDLDKFINADFTSASAVAGLETSGLGDASEALANVRGMQRLLLTGLALGPDSNGSIEYGNRLQLDEAFNLLAAGMYSSSVLARATQSQVFQALYRFYSELEEIQTSDSDEVKRAKSRFNNRVELLIASARQRAHLVSLAYINAKNHTTPALAAANRTPEDKLTFENQYNSSQYYDVPEHRSVYSTSAYLVALKELIDEHMQAPDESSNQHLSQRRPDIDQLILSADNALTLQPKLNIVNRVLRYHARDDDSDRETLTDTQQDNTQFPLVYPYNSAFDDITRSLEEVDSSIFNISRVLGARNSRVQDLEISPSMVKAIATDAAYGKAEPNFPDSNDTHTPWGYEEADLLDGSSSATDKPDPLTLVTEFARRAEIEEYQLHELFFGDLSTAEIAEDAHLALYFNSPATDHELDAGHALRVSADASEIVNLDSLRQDRLHRFLRMSKAAGLSFVALHRLLRATGNRLNTEFMRVVGAFARFNQSFDTSVDEFIALIADLRDVGKGNNALAIETPLRQIFYRPGQHIDLFNVDNELTNLVWQRDSSPESLSIRAEIAARLGISEAQLVKMSKIIEESGSFTLDKANLSALFRLTYLMQQLDVSTNELEKMFAAVSVDINDLTAKALAPITKLNAIEKLMSYVEDFQQINYSLIRAYQSSRTDNRLSVVRETLDNFHNNLQRSVENTPGETLDSFNSKLTTAGAEAIEQDVFDSIFDQNGIVFTPDYFSLNDMPEAANVLAEVNNDQITSFENTLVSELGVNPVYHREFTSWASTIVFNQSATTLTNAALRPITERLSGSNNDLRERLLDSEVELDTRKREYQILRQLSNILKQLQLTDNELRRLLLNPSALSDFELEQLPSVEQQLALKRYQLAVEDIDNANSPIFEIAITRDDSVTDTPELRTEVIEEIRAVYEEAEVSDIEPLLEHFMQGETGRPIYLTLGGLADIILAYRYSETSRIQSQCMVDILTLGTVENDTYDEASPLSLALDGSLSSNAKGNKEREVKGLENERDRLLSLALHRMRERNLPVTTANSLYRYLLLDVHVGGEAETSPVKEATCAMQLFGDAVVNNQEAEYTANDTFREYWEWMQYFTTWQANRRTFFETENFLLPDVRRNKSEAFKMLENKVNMALDDPEQADIAFQEFAEALLATVDLQNVGVSISADSVNPDAVVARTRNGSSRDVYIRFTNLTESEDNPIPYLGGEWEKLPLSLSEEDSVCISPVFDRGSWHLFWVTYQQSGQTPAEEALFTAQLNQLSQKADGSWDMPKIIRERKTSLSSGKKRNNYNFRYVSAYPTGSFKLHGDEDDLNHVWERQAQIEKDSAEGLDPTEILTNGSGYALQHPNTFALLDASELVNFLITDTNNAASESSRGADEAFYYEANYNYTDVSFLAQTITSVNNKSALTPVDGIVLSLPPVFGLLNGESINIRDYDGNVNNSAKVHFYNEGSRHEDNEVSVAGTPFSLTDAYDNVDTLILLPSGEQRLASQLRLEYTRDIEPRKGNTDEETYNFESQSDLRALAIYPINSGETAVRAVQTNDVNFHLDRSFLTAGTTLYQIFFGAISGQDYLFDKDSFKFIRTSSQAGTKLLERLRGFGIDRFMSFDSQRMSEAPFNVSNPHVTIAYPRPSERLSFNDFNGLAYRELFYHAPMLIATVLKNAEQYDQADRWYRYVYNPQANSQNFGMDAGGNQDFHGTSVQKNNFWQCLFLRNTAPSEFIGEGYQFSSAEHNSIRNNLVNFFRTQVDNQREPSVVFKAPRLAYGINSGDNWGDWISAPVDQSASELIIAQADDFSLNATTSNTVMRYKGTQYLARGTYYLQLRVDDGIAVFVNGDLVGNFDGGTANRYFNMPLNIEHSGIQHFEILYQNIGGAGNFRALIAAAQPGLELVRSRLASDSNIEAARLEDAHDFQDLRSQDITEQRLLAEINAVDDLSARQAYIRDPYNPHALAMVRPSAYQTWTFYEFLDNMIKKGDKLFRRLTREDLVEATLIYTRVSDLLGDAPRNMGELDYLPSDSNVDLVRKAGLLDFDGDGDVDLQDADIQAQRLVDGTGRLQGAFELMLEQRLSNVTRDASSAMLLTEAYSGEDASAVQTQPREVKLSSDGSTVMLAPITGAPNFAPQNYLNNSYFAIPPNLRTLRLWDTVASRLFNIRNSRDINGKRISLALTQPPLDPLALASSFASGGTLGEVRGSSNMAIPHYRFNYVINRAKEVTQMVSGFGTRLLSIMERQDATELEALRASHEQSILEMNAEVLRHQVMSVEHNLEIFRRQYETARYQEYRTTGLIGADASVVAETNADYQSLDNIPIDLEQADDNSDITSMRGDNGRTFPANRNEDSARAIGLTKNALEIASEVGFGVAELFNTAPNIFGLATGGHSYSAIGKGIVRIGLGTTIKGLDLAASITSENGSRERRKAGWVETRNLAIMDQAELKDRLIQGMHDLNAAMAQYTNLQWEMESNQEIEQFIRSERRTRTELYRWLSNHMSGLYFQAYQLALGLAKEAEQAFNFELGHSKSFIRGDYWDNTQQGLLAGDGLLLSLQRMQHDYEQNNARRLEIVKPISLKHNLDIHSAEGGFVKTTSGEGQGTNLVELLKNKPADERSIVFELPSRVFARDYPSHYRRLIKSVNVTIPAVVGPYQTLSATLTQTGNLVLLDRDKDAAADLAEERTNKAPTIPLGVRADYRNSQSIAVSGGVNDAGLFQLNFGDERLLPFENTGVDSKWQLEFSSGIPDEVFDSITDIIIEVNYYAEDGGSEVRSEVLNVL